MGTETRNKNLGSVKSSGYSYRFDWRASTFRITSREGSCTIASPARSTRPNLSLPAVRMFLAAFTSRSTLKQNGKKTVNVQVLVSRARKHLPTIQSDLELLEALLRRYEATKKR